MALLGTTAAGALTLATSDSSQAQTVIPPSAGPCVVVGTTATCTGDVSAGIDANAPLTTLNVNTLSQTIAPATGVDGIEFTDGGAATGVTIDVDTGAFGISTNGTAAGARGIEVIESGAGDVSVTSVGNITTNGTFDNYRNRGIDVFEFDSGSISIVSTGNITTQSGGRGISAEEYGSGDLSILSTGDITTVLDDRGISAVERDSGNLTLTSIGNIITIADDRGISAYEYGNGNLTVTSIGNITTIADDRGISAVEDGSGNLTVISIGNITTMADDHAIYARENDNGNLNVVSVGNLAAMTDDSGIEAREFGNGSVSVTSTGDIDTFGTNDPGIDVSEYGDGDVMVSSSGNVTAPGANSSGIRVFVDAASSLTVTLADGTIQGGSGTGAGVFFNSVAGSIETLNTSGIVTLSSLAGTSIQGGVGNTTVNNAGILNTVDNGAVELGGGTNAFNNMGGAIFNAGGIVNLGAGNLFNNSGTLSPGAAGRIQTTAITGNLAQNGGGIFLASVDPSAGTGDLVTVTGTANLAGTVQAHVINPMTGTQSVTILTATGGTTNNGLGLLTSPTLQASLSFPNANDVVLTYSIDFSAGGLNPNQTALANGLNAAADAGGGGLDPVFSPLLNNIFTVGDYRNALNQLLPEGVLNTETATLFSAEGFVDNLFSCRLAGENHTALSEGECYWARPQGRFLDRDSDANTIGFDETAGGLTAGAQIALAPNWFAGFALGYERASLETDTGAETDSNRFSGGLSLKVQAGSFLLGAAVSGGVSGNDTERPISIGGAGGFNATAESNYAIRTLTGQARAAYVFQFRDWFAKPLVDVTATYLSRDGVTETGAGAANLAIAGSDETFFSVTPALEIGGDFALSETATIRPYVRAGVSFYTDSDHGLTASFVNAPTGTGAFSITSDFDDVFADVAAGATAFFDNGSTLELSYEGLISSDTQQHGISLKGTVTF